MGTGYCRMVFLLLGIPTKFSKPFWTCQTSSFHAFSSSRILQRFLWAFPWAQVSITTPSGEVKTQECLTGADIVVQVGDEVTKDEPITTNPNVGGFGQAGCHEFRNPDSECYKGFRRCSPASDYIIWL